MLYYGMLVETERKFRSLLNNDSQKNNLFNHWIVESEINNYIMLDAKHSIYSRVGWFNDIIWRLHKHVKLELDEES